MGASPGVVSTQDSDLPTGGQGQHLPVGDRGQEWGLGLHPPGALWTELVLCGGGGGLAEHRHGGGGLPTVASEGGRF